MALELGTALVGTLGLILLAFVQVKRSLTSPPELVRVERDEDRTITTRSRKAAPRERS